MAKKSLTDLRAMLSGMKSDALASEYSDKLSNERSRAMEYYKGVMPDMPAEEGQSSAISTDVADTIEGLMPDLMEIFGGSEEIVRFDPVNADDVQAAKQETDYLNHIFFQKNPGWLIIYSMVKDALMLKNGVVKGWWETREEKTTETYYDQTEEQFNNIVSQVMASNGALEITEHEAKEEIVIDELAGQQSVNITHNLTLQTTHKYEQAKVMGVPPEEFGIERNARSIPASNYCFHKIITNTEADLIEQGYDPAQVKALPSYGPATNTEEMARDTVHEQFYAGSQANSATRIIEVIEHYVRMDYEGTGKVCLYKVTTAGGQEDVLLRDGKPDIEEMDAMPFAAMSPIIVPHRFIGRSIADLVIEIQRVKTALLRSMLTAQYFSNNPRSIVYEDSMSENTIDDLLVSRPNGIIRAAKQGGIEVYKTPGASGDTIPLLEYMDATREYRTGVTRQGQGIDADSLQNVSATATQQAYNASQNSKKMIARIFAETGIRDLFLLLHSLVRKHATQTDTVELRNEWVPIDPRSWRKRTDMTVKVGVGYGSRQERAANLTMLMGFQEKAAAAKLPLVKPENFYNSLESFCEIIGVKDVQRYFVDPSSPEGQQLAQQIAAQPDPKLQLAQTKLAIETAKTQNKAHIEGVQAAADIETNTRKINAEMVQSARDAELKRDLLLIQAELDRRKDSRAEQKHQREMTQDIVGSHIAAAMQPETVQPAQ